MRARTRRRERTFSPRGCSRIRRPPRTSACLWTASRKRKLRRRKKARLHRDDPRHSSGNNRSPTGGAAYAAGGKRHDRDQRRAHRERNWRFAIDGVAARAAASRVGRESEGPARDWIFPGTSAGHLDAGYAAAPAEGEPVRQAHSPFFQDGFDESGGAGVGARRRAGRYGGRRGRTDGGTRASGTRLVFGAGGGDLCDALAAAASGASAGAFADDDGGAVRARRGRGSDRSERGFEMAERFAYWREKGGRNLDGNARGADPGAICDRGDWVECESGEISG